MSAYMVSDEHLIYLAEVAFAWAPRHGTRRYFHAGAWHEFREGWEGKRDLCLLLWGENSRSVAYRYPADPAGMGAMDPPKLTKADFAHTWADFPAAQVLKAVHCLAYQSCEAPGHESTAAYAVLEAISGAAQRKVPGYEAAVWGVPERSGRVVSLLSMMER